MALDMTTADAILKELYPDDVMKSLTYRDHPFLAMVKKDENFVGDRLIVPLSYGNPQGRGAKMSHIYGGLAGTGNSSIGNTQSKKWVLQHKRDYSIVMIDNLTIEASASKKGAFISALKMEIDNGIAALSKNISDNLFGAGDGVKGTVAMPSPAVNFTSFTLDDINDVVKFEVGMQLEFDLTTPEAEFIVGINRTTGVITMKAAITVAAADDGDTISIYQVGDKGEGIINGLAAWIPTTAPTSGDSFADVDRSVDVTRLAGLRFSTAAVGGQVDELLEALSSLGREGASPDVIFCSFPQFANIVKLLDGQVRYKDVKKAGIGFQALEITGPRGTVKVIPDASCPRNIAYILTMDTWKLWSSGPITHVLDRDGRLKRSATSDDYECRIGSYAELSCSAPGFNAVVTLNAA